jgi:hypothetical protein
MSIVVTIGIVIVTFCWMLPAGIWVATCPADGDAPAPDDVLDLVLDADVVVPAPDDVVVPAFDEVVAGLELPQAARYRERAAALVPPAMKRSS